MKVDKAAEMYWQADLFLQFVRDVKASATPIVSSYHQAAL
jgi:hypothetical protein